MPPPSILYLEAGHSGTGDRGRVATGPHRTPSPELWTLDSGETTESHCAATWAGSLDPSALVSPPSLTYIPQMFEKDPREEDTVWQQKDPALETGDAFPTAEQGLRNQAPPTAAQASPWKPGPLRVPPCPGGSRKPEPQHALHVGPSVTYSGSSGPFLKPLKHGPHPRGTRPTREPRRSHGAARKAPCLGSVPVWVQPVFTVKKRFAAHRPLIFSGP